MANGLNKWVLASILLFLGLILLTVAYIAAVNNELIEPVGIIERGELYTCDISVTNPSFKDPGFASTLCTSAQDTCYPAAPQSFISGLFRQVGLIDDVVIETATNGRVVDMQDLSLGEGRTKSVLSQVCVIRDNPNVVFTLKNSQGSVIDSQVVSV